MARFTLLRAKVDPASLTVHIQWATSGADRVLIDDALFSRRGRARIPASIGARLTLTAVGRSGAGGESRSIYLTPTFEAPLPLTSRPLQPWRDYLAARSAASAQAVTGFRRMLIDLRAPRMSLGQNKPVKRSGLQPARVVHPIAHSPAELHRKREDRWQTR